MKSFIICSGGYTDKNKGCSFDYCFAELRNNDNEGLRPEEAIMIGDSLTSDIAGGRNYGMKTCFYTKGKKYESGDKWADYVVSDLSDIMRIL